MAIAFPSAAPVRATSRAPSTSAVWIAPPTASGTSRWGAAPGPAARQVRSETLHTSNLTWVLHRLVQPLGQLNGRPPRIDQRHAADVVQRRGEAIRRGLDAFCREPLGELFQVPHFETDVIDGASCG